MISNQVLTITVFQLPFWLLFDVEQFAPEPVSDSPA